MSFEEKAKESDDPRAQIEGHEPTEVLGSRRTHAAIVFAVALIARLALVLWAAPRFPPAADGTLYHRLATQISVGAGYTWVWDDGAVTPVAHFPVGYPALLAGPYALFGAHAGVAMGLAAFLGAIGAVCIYLVAARDPAHFSPRAALFAGLIAALHPALLPYTAALMTEGITASLLAIVLACRPSWDRCASNRTRSQVLFGLLAAAISAVLVLVRPQNLLLLPFLALATAPPNATLRARVTRMVVGPLLALLFVLPWTARNCRTMHRCALVSMNGGWNLLIGAHAESGGWSPVAVPPACTEVWDEAEKDICFERAAKADIAKNPRAFLALIPRKLLNTFEYVGAAAWYLHTSNPKAFSERAKTITGGLETLFLRALLAAALASQVRVRCTYRTLRFARRGEIFAMVAAVAIGLASTTLGYLLLAGLAVHRRATALEIATAAAVFSTAAVHAVFFGAGRYALVVLPFVAALAARRLGSPPVEATERGTG